MSCLNALHLQVGTFLSVPHEVLFLQHKVFREYARTAVGPDFIHTLPSFLVLTAMGIVLWKNPPSFNWLPVDVGKATLYRALQVSVSWIAINGGFWLWLILQRILYCSVWTYWSRELEYTGIPWTWWQRVWAMYYPPPLQPPTLSAAFISWIVSMLLAVTTLGCAVSTSRVQALAVEAVKVLRETVAVVRCYVNRSSGRLRDAIACEKEATPVESSEIGSASVSELSTDVANNHFRRDVHPISYGTNWTPRPSFSPFKEAQRKFSVKSMRTAPGVSERQEDEDKYSPRQLRHRRGCHTVIPSNSSDRSSKC